MIRAEGVSLNQRREICMRKTKNCRELNVRNSYIETTSNNDGYSTNPSIPEVFKRYQKPQERGQKSI